MSSLSPVVWSEGMHLAQHHFQVQSRYFEAVTSFALSALYYRPWGLAGCELDDEALVNGTVTVRHARGVMPDGLAFDFPEDPPPEPLAIRELFSPTRTAHRVLLAVPPYRPDKRNVADGADAPGDPRFVPMKKQVQDDTTGNEAKPVPVARKNFRLLLEGTSDTEDLVTLPLARVKRDGSGRFVYDPDYVPPCVQIGASPRLMAMLRRLVEVLDVKAQTLKNERRGGAGEPASGDILGFWLSHAIQSASAPLRHHLRTRSGHPEDLYREMARLAGALCTFSMEAHPRDLPDYDHEDLETTFTGLERHIRTHLDVVLPEGSIDVPLERFETFYRRGPIKDARCLHPAARWFLGVRSSLARSEVIDSVPGLVKVCSDDGIKKLVQRAYEGLPLQHLPSPPSVLAPRIGTEYFLVRTTGPCWTAIQRSAGVGIYVPGSLADAEVDLVVAVEE